MYYIGTLKECEAYNDKVSKGEGYSGQTKRWAEAKKHPEQDLYVIVKHDKYECEMKLVKELSEDWTPKKDDKLKL